MDWEELRGQEGLIVKWVEKYSAVTLVSESKRMVEEVREIFRDKNMNMSALVLKAYRVEELVMKSVHQLTRESRLDELEEALTQLPDLMFASCIPNLSYVELTHHFPATLPFCSRIIARLHRSRHRHNLPVPIIDTIFYQLCVWLFSSTLQDQNYSQFISEVRECIHAILLLEPNFLARVEKKREEINSILDAIQTVHPTKSIVPAVQIEDLIMKEVNYSLTLFDTASSKLSKLSQQEIISIGQMLHEGLRPSFLFSDDDSITADSPLTYTQLEERIGFSISMLTAVRPVMSAMREDKLPSLLNALKLRVESDKAAVALIDKLSTHSFDTLLQDEPIELILQKYNQGIEILLSILANPDLSSQPANSEEEKESDCVISPELFSHKLAFQTPTVVVSQEEHSSVFNPITSTPLHSPPSIPSTDEIRVIHTPELQTATLHTIPTSPSQLTQLDSQYIISASPSNSDTTQHFRIENDSLKARVYKLEGKLTRSRTSLIKLSNREKELKRRISYLSKKQVLQDMHLEDVYVIQHRRSEVVLRFSDLYSHERLDCLDGLRTLNIAPDMSYVILFSILKISYQCLELEDNNIRLQWKTLLQATSKSPIATQSIEDSIYAYLRKENAILPSLKPVLISKIKSLIAADFSDISIDFISSSEPTLDYIRACIDLCWSMLIQTPQLYIQYNGNRFNPGIHKRFFASSEQSQTIKQFVWPVLLERDTLRILSKGLVIT